MDIDRDNIKIYKASIISIQENIQGEKMSCPQNSEKPHAVCVPYSAQGHVSPFMQLIKLLHWKGFTITMVDTQSYHTRLLQSLGPDFAVGLPGFRVETIPDGLAYSGGDANPDVSELSDALRKNCKTPFKDLIKRMETSGLGKVRCIIADGVMSFANEVGRELGIPEVQFWTASACGLLAYLQFDELIHRGIIPFKGKVLTLHTSKFKAMFFLIDG